MTEQSNIQQTTLEPYNQVELNEDDLEQYNELGLPHTHPHLFAKALLAQLARIPLMEMDREQELFAQHTVALSA